MESEYFPIKHEPPPKNPKSGRSRYDRHRSRGGAWIFPSKHMGNSTSHTGSRPTLPLERLYVKAENQDIVKYTAVDVRAVTDIAPRRKTFAPNIEGLRFRHMNQQQHYISQPTKPKKVPIQRCVHLPSIHENLYLSNLEYSRNHASEYDFVINLSETIVKVNRDKKTKVFHFYMQDTSLMSFPEFKKIIMKISNVLEENLAQGKVLIHCAAGVNRSPAAIVAYAILKQQKPVATLVKNIEYRKADNDSLGHWDTLTNLTFLHYLENLKLSIHSEELIYEN